MITQLFHDGELLAVVSVRTTNWELASLHPLAEPNDGLLHVLRDILTVGQNSQEQAKDNLVLLGLWIVDLETRHSITNDLHGSLDLV